VTHQLHSSQRILSTLLQFIGSPISDSPSSESTLGHQAPPSPPVSYLLANHSAREGALQGVLWPVVTCCSIAAASCTATIYVRCMVRTPITLFTYCLTAQ